MPNHVQNILKFKGITQEEMKKVISGIDDNGEEILFDFNKIIPMPKTLNIISGGYQNQYIQVYLDSLSSSERFEISNKLREIKDPYYKNYYARIIEYSHAISKEDLINMKSNYKKEYANINPKSIIDVGKCYIDNLLNYGADTWCEWSCNHWGTKWNAYKVSIEDSSDTNYDGEITFRTAWSSPFPIFQELAKKLPNVVFDLLYADEDYFSENCGHFQFQNEELYEIEIQEDFIKFSCNVWDDSYEDFLAEYED